MTHLTVPPFINAAFPSLFLTDGTAPMVDAACTTIEAEWNGIFTLFQTTPNPPAKQAILEGYLVGWWLMDLNPASAVGISGDGGMPLTSKSIGGVSMTRKDLEAVGGLKQLESNAFGVKALSMIKNAPEMFQLYGQITSLGPGGWGSPVTGLPGFNNGV